MKLPVFALSLLIYLGIGVVTAAPQSAFDYSEATVDQLQQAMQNETLTSEAIVRHYYQRIAQHNERGADLRAVTQLLPLTEALAIARQLDQERAGGNVRGPLHGIPLLLKDNIDTKDGLANTAGSVLLATHKPDVDATLVTQLRKAGAIIIGKSNLSEWANFRSTRSSSGWSSFGGQTKNPFDTTRSPCGSSAGSAVAVSANLIPMAVGTETDGSLVCPASATGIVTIKPTLGLVSRRGIIPIANSQDTAGPMARTVRDAVYLLMAMQGEDNTDPDNYVNQVDLTEHLMATGLRNKRIGVVRDMMGYHGGLDMVFEQQLAVLKEAGAVIVDDIELGRGWAEDEFTVLVHEFKRDLNAYLARHPNAPYKNLSELVEANRGHKDAVMPFFQQELFEMAQARTDAQTAEYEQALVNAKRLAGKDGIDRAIRAHNLDLLIAPTTGPAWKIDLINGDHYSGSASSAAAVAGYPHITVPMGFVQHLPVGMSFFAGARSEPTLIEAAYSYEQARQARREPALMPRDH